jgi:two-component system invasion response regulator UvrY
MKSKIKILFVDDHALLRAGIKLLLADVADIEIAGEAATVGEAIQKLHGGTWDLVLLDISLPGRSGLDLLKQVKARTPDLPVLILSMYPEEQYAIRVLRAGASGYLTKESAPGQLVAAIRKVAQGGRYVSPTVAERLVDELGGDRSKAPHETLSDREFEVFRFLASGRTVGQIASAVNLSVKTVSTHRRHVLNKMRMSNNADLTQYAVRHGLLDWPDSATL